MLEIELREFEGSMLDPDDLSRSVLDVLFERFGDQVDIEWPSPKTDFKLSLKAGGWVGFIPFEDVRIVLKPKVPLENLFGMLEYAHDTKIEWPEGTVQTDSLLEVYERLANVLAKRVLDRSRRGLYREYESRSEPLSFVRGRVELDRMIRKPWSVRPECEFQEHTPDLEDNQIVSWTLRALSRAGFPRAEVRNNVTTAYRRLNSHVSLVPFQGHHCVGRSYNRLNEDYATLHALSRFFLDHSGPGLRRGGYSMLPFLVNMAPLFEKFVAEWLRRHLRWPFEIDAQHRVVFDDDTRFIVDLVLFDRSQAVDSSPRLVLDTKYKYRDAPDESDIHQVVSYAVAKRANEAVLVYPTHLAKPLDIVVGDQVRVRSATFDIGHDLMDGGLRFVRDIGAADQRPSTGLPGEA